jgi:hypothetical protein
MKENKTWLILPMLAFSKLSNGRIQIDLGWIKYIFSITI